MIYWFTGASTQAVTAGAYSAVEFIKKNIKLEGRPRRRSPTRRRSSKSAPSTRRRDVQHLPRRLLRHARVRVRRAFFFIGYLISIALFGSTGHLHGQRRRRVDNAKKVVEVDLKEKGTPLHDATVVGDTVGDPFKDTSSSP